MSSIFACDLGLNRKTFSRNFFCCFVFRFREIFFNQHWRRMRASLILLFGKTKAFFGKDTARKKTTFLHTLFVENERETSKLKYGGMFFYEVEGHMLKLSSFGQGKTIRHKKSLTSFLHAALHLELAFFREDFSSVASVNVRFSCVLFCFYLLRLYIKFATLRHGGQDLACFHWGLSRLSEVTIFVTDACMLEKCGTIKVIKNEKGFRPMEM